MKLILIYGVKLFILFYFFYLFFIYLLFIYLLLCYVYLFIHLNLNILIFFLNIFII